MFEAYRSFIKAGWWSAAAAFLVACVTGAQAWSGPQELKPDSCGSPDACLERVFELAEAWPEYRGPYTVPHGAIELGMRVKELDEDLTADLVALLADENQYVANVASVALGQLREIDARHLDDILLAFERGTEGAGGALGKVASSRAAEEAVTRLLSAISRRGALEFAVRRQGDRAIPFLVEAARCADGCSEKRHALLGDVLEEMGPERAQAGPALMAIAGDESQPIHVRSGALSMIARLGSVSNDLGEQIVDLQAANPGLSEQIERALIAIESEAAGAIFAKRLSHQPKVETLKALSRLGPAGYSAGPVVMELLRHEDWNIRLEAARVLGVVGYEPAADPLAEMLEVQEDVVLNWIAADALGRLNDPGSVDALKRAADRHWHPSVRKRADLARRQVLGEEKVDVPMEVQRRFDAESAFAGMSEVVDSCDEVLLSLRALSEETKRLADPDSRGLEEFSFEVSRIRQDRSGESVERMVEITPRVALRVASGWLVGSFGGEWGGQLAFLDEMGEPSILYDDDNVADISRLGDGIVVLTGMMHMTSNRGMMHRVERNADGIWSMTPWRRLPGAPRSVKKVSSGELLVNTNRRGSLLVSPDGRMRMAACAGDADSTRVFR